MAVPLTTLTPGAAIDKWLELKGSDGVGAGVLRAKVDRTPFNS